MDPILSAGEGSALEAGLGAVLERVNKTAGFVCHEVYLRLYKVYIMLTILNSNVFACENIGNYRVRFSPFERKDQILILIDNLTLMLNN